MNLNTNTRYYVRAYATNNIGTSYGIETMPIYFNTRKPLPQVTTNSKVVNNLIAYAAVINVGEPAYYEKGFCWNTEFYPSLTNKKIVEGNSVGAFDTTLPNSLAPEEFYQVWAYAVNDYDTVFSNSMICITELPLFYGLLITNVGTNSVTVEDLIQTTGNPYYIESGFCYSTTPNSTISNNKKIVEGRGQRIIETTITGLSRKTKYYIRAYAKNVLGIQYGNELSFTTE